MRLTKDKLIQNVRANMPDLLAWDRAKVVVIKDPAAPLRQLSDLGVIHAGVEKDSQVYRVSDETSSFIVKQHFNPTVFRTEVANITFLNRSGPVAAELFFTDEDTGTIVMEDLGDRSLAYLWHEGRMAEYVNWAYRAASILAAVQADFEGNRTELATLYGTAAMERSQRSVLPGGLSDTLSEVVRISRAVELAGSDRANLEEVERQLRARINTFNARHKSFLLDLTFFHAVEKDGAIRVLDLTAPAVGGPVGQFNFVWRLQQRREIIRSYLAERQRLGAAKIDPRQFLWLEDAVQLLECIEWISSYCKEILQNEHSFTNLDGTRLEDYAGSERANLEAIYRALEPHDDLCKLIDLLERYFRVPLVGGASSG